jgi:Primase C terminal 2 (PriCT-2)/RepB DNA-primase from phage plasmid
MSTDFNTDLQAQPSRAIAPAMDLDEARRFLKLLDPNATTFTFQTFDDDQERKDGTLARAIVTNDVADPRLLELYARGSGIWVTVSETNGRGRKSADIVRFRSIWQEDDDEFDGELPLEPGIVVVTSPGKCHRYWPIADDWPADEQGRRDHAAVLDRLVADYGSDNGAKGPNRVLRVPGFLHRKDPDNPHMVRISIATGRRYTRAEILAAFPPLERKAGNGAANGHLNFTRADVDVELERARDALRYIPADDYDTWVTMGMALENRFGEKGRPLWDDWSARSDKYDARDQELKWRSFSGSGLTIATLFHRARQAGWRPAEETIIDDLIRANASEAAEQDDPGLATLNAKYAVVLVGSKARVMRIEESPVLPGCKVPAFMAFEDFRAFHMKWRTQVTDANGNAKSIGIGHWWLDHPRRRQYDGIVYAPGGAPANYLNLWTGFGCEPREGDCGLYLEHLKNNICTENQLYNNYLLDWMANAVQNPGQQGEVAVVMRGPEGAGKGVFARQFGRLFGAHFRHVAQAHHLSGRFNTCRIAQCCSATKPFSPATGRTKVS